MDSTDRFVVFFMVTLISFGNFIAAQEELCVPRHAILPPGRTCSKTCDRHTDCKSGKKKCRCDGVCGKSCIKNKLTCPDLRIIDHGSVRYMSENRQFGAIAQYICSQGYILRGQLARVCQGDQTWSGETPSCLKDMTSENIECSSPPEVHNAKHDGIPNQRAFKLGSMLQYQCEWGYTLQRDAVVRAWCVDKGTWVGPNMTCSNAGCNKLEAIDNGWVDQDPSNTIGSKAVYRCKMGYFLAGRAERTCKGPHGVWDGVQPSCEKVTCGPPPSIENAQHDGDIDQQRYPSGRQLMFTCNYGYHRDGSQRVMCSGEGTWIGLTLTCSPQTCGFPGDIENGQRTGFSFTYPNKVNFYCYDGFELKGVGHRRCQASGQWSDDVPTCEPVTCPTLFAPVYGRMYGSGNTFGTVVRFECDEGFKVVGYSERRCQADRTWSGQTAKCEEINCGWPAPFYNGYLIGSNTRVGAIYFFSCNVRTTMEDSPFQTQCMESGEWSHPPPICWGQCEVEPIPNATFVEGRDTGWVNHGNTIEYRCKHGLVPRFGPTVRCQNGTWSNKAECVPAPCPTPPPHVYNGIRIFLGQEHGFRAKYKCFAGFKLTGMNSSYLTCHFGEWRGGRPHCEEFYCPSPRPLKHGKLYKKVNNGKFDFQTYIRRIKHGDRLEYECNAGYRTAGPSGATCVNGQWQPPLTNPGTKCVKANHPPFKKLWTPISNMYK